MFLLDYLPYWAVVSFIAIGAIGYVANSIFPPFITLLGSKGIEFFCIVVMVFGVYLLGGTNNQARWETKVKEVQAEVAQKESRSNEANVKIVEKIVIQKQIIKEKRNETKKAIIKNEASVNTTCELSNAFVVLHDSASQAKIPPSTIPDAETPSNVKASEALDIIAENYLTYYELRDLVLQWQEWYKTQKEIQEK